MQKFLNLLFLIILTVVWGTYAKPEAIKLKTVKNAYTRIIHFSPEDYYLTYRSPGDERPRYGAQGIYAGESHLIVWDINNFYVFDLNSHEKLAKIKSPFSIRDIIECQGKIYCLTINDHIYEYDSFENYRKYRFISSYKNLADYKKSVEILSEPIRKAKTSKAYRKKISEKEQLAAEIEKMESQLPKMWPKMQISSLHCYQNEVYLNVENNYLNMKQEVNYEQMNTKNFLFLKQPVRGKANWTLSNNSLIQVKRWGGIGPTNDKISYEIRIKDFFSKDYNSQFFKVELNSKQKYFVSGIPFAIIKDILFLNCVWKFPNEKHELGLSVFGFDLKKQDVKNIELPNHLKKLHILTNNLKYYSFTISSLFILSYNNDYSFDILELEVNKL